MRQEETHLKNAKRIFLRQEHPFHTLDGGGMSGGAGMNLFAAFGAVPPEFHGPTSTLKVPAPARLASRRDFSPRHCARRAEKAGTGAGYFMRDLDEHLRIDARFFGGEFRRVANNSASVWK
jgi:hypothetical protein